jgi:hypothetical protein
MNTRRTTHTLTALAAAAALTAALTGCNAAADARPTETIGRCTDCTARPTATATSTTLDAAAKEKADRAAAETVWRKFDSLTYTVEKLAPAEAEAAITSVTTEPQLSRFRTENAQFRAEGKVGYGLDISYITWPEPIGGRDTAVLNDCQDGSQAGLKDAKTGNKLSVGTVNTPFQATLKRTPDGWKVSEANIIQGEACTPGK